MSTGTKNLIIILSGLVIVLLILKLLLNDEKIIQPGSVIIRDTVIRTIEAKPIILHKVKTKVINRIDTIIKTHPFTATLDTILDGDSLNVVYQYPEHLLSLELRQTADSVRFINSHEIKYIEKKTHWWESPVLIGSGMCAGIIIGLIIK